MLMVEEDEPNNEDEYILLDNRIVKLSFVFVFKFWLFVVRLYV